MCPEILILFTLERQTSALSLISILIRGAVDVVFSADLKIVLVPLDATNKVPITRRFYESAREQSEDSSIMSLIYQLLKKNERYLGSADEESGIFWWDVVASSVLLDNTIVATSETMRLSVSYEVKSWGAIQRDAEGHELLVVKSINKPKFIQLITEDYSIAGPGEANSRDAHTP